MDAKLGMTSGTNLGLGFNFMRFINFLDKNNIAATATAAVLSFRINDFTNVFFDELILPIINRDGDHNGEKDIKKFEQYVITIYGVKFKIGLIMLSIFKFIIVSYIIFIIFRIFNNIKEK